MAMATATAWHKLQHWKDPRGTEDQAFLVWFFTTALRVKRSKKLIAFGAKSQTRHLELIIPRLKTYPATAYTCL